MNRILRRALLFTFAVVLSGTYINCSGSERGCKKTFKKDTAPYMHTKAPLHGEDEGHKY